MNRLQHSLYYIGIILGSILLWGILSVSGLLDGVEQEAMRWRYLARGERASSAPIVYVDLDADSVGSIGARPWDRANFAVLLHALLGPGQARAVGVDIIFSQIGHGSLLDLERARAGDVALGQAVSKYRDEVVLAAAYTGTTGADIVPLIRMGFDDPRTNTFPESPSYPIIDWGVGRLGLANVDETLGRGVIPRWVVGFVDVEGELYSRILMFGMRNQLYDVLNEPQIVEDEQNFTLIDKDGWAPHQIPRESEHTLYSLGLELFLAAHGLKGDDVEISADELVIRKGDEVFRRVPLVGQQSVEVNWFEGWNVAGPTEHYSMQTVRERAAALSQAAKVGDVAGVIELEQWFQRFKDKVIFVGPVDPQLKDIAPTPFNREPVPKVGVHANLFRTLEDEAYVSRVSAVQGLWVMALLAVTVAVFAVWGGRGRSFTRFGSIILVTGYGIFVFVAFGAWHLVLPLIAPIGASVTAAFGVILLKLGTEEWQKRRIKTLFGAYVSPELVDQMVEAQRDPELGGAEAEITALFSDVEGFSTLSEELPPDQLVALMNEYLGAMTDALQVEGGTLDKYIGDAIVTMFGMPLPLVDHAARACIAAQRMQERHAALREQWTASGKWPEAILKMRTRIGLNTGHAVIGNMGSSFRFNYTMMGDSVNLAARCESGAKTYGIYTMVTDVTLQAALAVCPDLEYRKLDRIIVKGRSKPVEVFELWDGSMDLAEAAKCKEHYEAGLQHYFKGDWSAALACLELSEPMEPSRSYGPTTPSAVIAQRCRSFLQSGVPEGWDGAYRMETK
ncbi:MAG: adenylate/guanylate cyclase domain-containing protein [Opitutales bacterium]|nr:adenylate/guanylate cyclase domain-containing protein [Opitutales bacterium]MDP4643574.1 adenylate/guanylate cyclase domain-containing protein [Opitutales bacterium]MDP4778344.1 adenylate/guanylate cyclase domain-containing protein [Opitutales bacterium]MDP4884035.1 adenylate/guanylate cyclase domain-containing protein [Opitutales bacterium]MDP5080610.1 adenylate/guanylate cyclase domain-containing protein [Opitutales bacterium]